MKNTVQNSIFRNWIRKKMNFVRLQSYFFIFQPYMSEKSSVEDSAKCFPAQIYGIFRLVPRSVKSNPYKEIIRIDISNNLETPRPNLLLSYWKTEICGRRRRRAG